MNGAALYRLWSEATAFAPQADALLTRTYHQIDPEMATFIGFYFVGLQHDFCDALQAESCEREAFLRLIIGEMRDLVHDIQLRITEAEAGNTLQTMCRTLA
jgi:hypothetical protein